jgi:serine/threonine protein kinase
VFPRGAVVAGYEVGDVLGRGGMAVVYEAREQAGGREVALKVFAAASGMDPSFRRRFQREGRIQAGIDHPSIATVYEAGEWEDALFIAMRLVRGQTLKDLTIAGGLESERLLRILTPIAAALDAAHAAGLTHRDVKPQNILVGEGDRAFLADFGLTKGHGDTVLTRAGEFVGTIDYCAPEQIRGEPATAAADIYALGSCSTSASPAQCRSRATPTRPSCTRTSPSRRRGRAPSGRICRSRSTGSWVVRWPRTRRSARPLPGR